jgi:hypothetical protein
MKQKLVMLMAVISMHAASQKDSVFRKKERLDFAKTYFEVGGNFLPSFTGKRLVGNEIQSFKNPASMIQYLTWGGFHFWGHAELYATFPLNHLPFKKNEEAGSEIMHSVATGARFYPWAYREKKIRPYLGISWSALDFRQMIKSDQRHTTRSKDIMAGFDAGIVYGYHGFSARVGINYFPNTNWNYYISRAVKTTIKTPDLGLQIGIIYSYESSGKQDTETAKKWNEYPMLSRQMNGSEKFGAFFIGTGPSMSFSLSKSEFNQQTFPYLKDKLASSNYFDIAIGYQFQKAGLFTAISFRNPKFVTEGFGTKQTIRKTSLALDITKFLFDFSGFAPFAGINISYDQIKYNETDNDTRRALVFGNRFEPGITFGWDIQPGKNQEALILRTNLRWYPLSSFRIDGKKFNFEQLEYNLIQVIFYPERFQKRKK